MKFENLRKEDRELIKRSMLNHSVSLTSEALECKEAMSKEAYEKTMRDADRLIFLVNVLNDRKNYD
ncbi:hypothetical protein [Clostridium thermobutyricum]|nr:hypothetical protein [Clostridium thermobutyricum]